MTKTTKNDIEMFKIKSRDEKITKIVMKLIDMFKYATIYIFVFLSIKTIAGQVTITDINVNVDINTFSEMIEKILKRKMIIIDVLCIIFGIAGIMYGIKQSKLRKDTIERLQGRNKALELKVDPGRSSSKLTKRGETSEGDK